MWKAGSELQSTTWDRLDPVDPLVPVLCPKLGFGGGETILFAPGEAPGSPGSRARLWEALGELWEVPGELWEGLGSSGTALRGSILRHTSYLRHTTYLRHRRGISRQTSFDFTDIL